MAHGKEGNLPLEEFKVGGPQKERQTADCICRVPRRPSFPLQPWCTQHTHPFRLGFFPAPLCHPHPHICCFFPIVLKPRMLLAGSLPPISSMQPVSHGSHPGRKLFMLEIIQRCKTPSESCLPRAMRSSLQSSVETLPPAGVIFKYHS